MIDARSPIPEVMSPVLLEEPWDLERLWSMWLPTESFTVADLVWQLELPWWRADGRDFAVSPAQVAADPDRYPDQWERTHDADLLRPIFVMRRERLAVLDGVHRLLKAHHLGWIRIMGHAVPPDALTKIAVRPEGERSTHEGR